MKGNKNIKKEMIGNSKKKNLIIVIECLLAVILVISITLTLILLKEHNTQEAGESNISIGSTVSTESALNSASSKLSINFLYPEDYWAKYDLTNATYKTKAEYETTVCTYIDQIAALLGKKDWYQQYTDNNNSIYIKLVISEAKPEPREYIIDPSDSNTNTLTFDLTFGYKEFESHQLELLTALTHLVMYDKKEAASSFSKSLDAGLCEYVENYLGKESVVSNITRKGMNACNYGVDIHKFVNDNTSTYSKDDWAKKTYQVDVDKISSSVGATLAVYPYSLQTNQGMYWLRSSYSFVDYLVQTYGLEAVVKLCDGQNDSAYNVLNKNGLTALVSDWKQFLSKYPTMTPDEVKYFTTVCEGHSESYRNSNGYYE